MSGTMRLADWKLCAGCHHGRAWRMLTPPPPPADAVYGAGYTVSFHGPVDAMLLSSLSVRFVPPTARTQGELAGHDTAGSFSALVSWLGGIPRLQGGGPLSPPATAVGVP